MFKDVKLINPERFNSNHGLTDKMVNDAINNVIKRLDRSLERFSDCFPVCNRFRNNEYIKSPDVDWTTSLFTGCYWLAYEITGDEKFKKAADKHCEICKYTADNEINLDDHDTGFKFIPSSIASYKLTGNEIDKETALKAAKILLDHYSFEGKFIIRGGKNRDDDPFEYYRTLVDSMMNISLFFWAHQMTGDKVYYDAAKDHYETTIKYLIKEDGSSFHHYQFDTKTHKPLYGVTLQGITDDSCWARGHSWLLYGFPTAYKYTKDDKLIDAFKAVTNYYLNNLPKDNVPYWDFAFKDGSFEVRDASAAVIGVCGMFEACDVFPDGSIDKEFYRNAACTILKTVIEKCENEYENLDGLIKHVTGSKPHAMSVDSCGLYGDYYYFEALVRYIKPDWIKYW